MVLIHYCMNMIHDLLDLELPSIKRGNKTMCNTLRVSVLYFLCFRNIGDGIITRWSYI